jgi:RNA polymerase sigma factor (TIGR02999 family)
MNNVDRIIEQTVAGDRNATRNLFGIIYDDLRKAAAARLAGEDPGNTLTPTALVHEAFIKLGSEATWNDSAHLYRTAARAMRQILVDAARRKKSQKRGGGRDRNNFDPNEAPARPVIFDPVELHEAIERLEAASSQAVEVFELRYYAGLTWEEIAQNLGISVEKTESLWSYVRAKLMQSLSPD